MTRVPDHGRGALTARLTEHGRTTGAPSRITVRLREYAAAKAAKPCLFYRHVAEGPAVSDR